MRKPLLLAAALLLTASLAHGQISFATLNGQAAGAYQAKRYAESGKLYDRAFKAKQARPTAGDYYNAACSWALAGNPRQAFRYLDQATEAGWENLAHLQQDPDLASLHADKRWAPMLTKLQAAATRREANYNRPLKQQLDSIYALDQGGRQRYGIILNKYGQKSPQMDSLIQAMDVIDARNLRRITALLDAHGWPSKAAVGNTGTQTVFLVLQHSDLPTLQKYFPLAQQAAEQGNLAKSELALMQDRLLMWQGKGQLYGSQVVRNPNTGKLEFAPIEDETRVDERRATVGLGPLADYAKRFGFEYTPKK
ncbi:DUF6624 domain-containing protein [Hymenobacter sp. B81]|uniref:DUF6624 domain-containing protein n=1 Tax=Hymenobacter sp. B81 TaxID=3344878 RepID=UPI0037DC6958